MLVAASLLAGTVHASSGREAFKPAPHRTEPVVSAHGFVSKPLRAVTVIQQTGGLNNPQ